jgi:hypothetical protein
LVPGSHSVASDALRGGGQSNIHPGERRAGLLQGDRYAEEYLKPPCQNGLQHPLTPPTRSTAMSKAQKNNKEAKKQSLLSPKEKKAVKQAKKHAGDIVPLIVH